MLLCEVTIYIVPHWPPREEVEDTRFAGATLTPPLPRAKVPVASDTKAAAGTERLSGEGKVPAREGFAVLDTTVGVFSGAILLSSAL
jgi:hypothetical protein